MVQKNEQLHNIQMYTMQYIVLYAVDVVIKSLVFSYRL